MQTLSLAAILSVFVICISSSAKAEINHEDIRDAILTLINMFRGSADKLERHEQREKQLGDFVKKTLEGLDKKQDLTHRSATNAFQKIETRILDLETNIAAKSEETLPEIQKLINKVDDLSMRLESATVQGNSAPNTKIDELNSRMDRLEQMLLNIEKLVSQPNESEKSLTGRYMYTTSDIESRLDEHSLALQELLSKFQAGVSANDIHGISNTSQALIQEIKYEILGKITLLEEDVETLSKNGALDKDLIALSIGEIVGERTEKIYSEIQKQYEQLLKEVKGLVKVEEVLIQTADNVLDTKRRIEYGVHQILLEVGDLVKTQSKDLNTTINNRFDVISATILENQNGGLLNLSSKIETEISQVWRQIGIMYQTLTSSAQALDRLQQQTEIYVNGSLSTMDNMEGKVGQITGRMSEVDENLNFLLGKLSLVTHEFNQIKSGLGEALDGIRSSFLEVQSKVKQVEDVGPGGPYPIVEEDVINDNTLSKTKYNTS